MTILSLKFASKKLHIYISISFKCTQFSEADCLENSFFQSFITLVFVFGLTDTEQECVDAKLVVVLKELNVYYQKPETGIFAKPAVWVFKKSSQHRRKIRCYLS